ncbi:hypothetical protein B0I37DRAFT_214723 [Chaetomium sp. MPI-CAGE-AT-0009]|nr:hypothetical protein B0I37DRAFT_214723 [Chaetomium sp. MPI-CAGE-AT-0009]
MSVQQTRRTTEIPARSGVAAEPVHTRRYGAAGSPRSSSVGADYRDSQHDAIEELRTTAIYSSLGSLLNSNKFSDMTICCDGREFKGHRAIICTQSSFFDKALTGAFSEAVTGVIDLPEDDPDVLARFLQFLYTGNYEDETHPAWTKPVEITMLNPEEIEEELRIVPGVHVAATADGWADGANPRPSLSRAEATTTSPNGIADGSGDGHGNARGDAKDGSYQSDSELWSRAPSEPEEPEEEYNEFDKESDVHRDDEDEYSKRYRELRDGDSDKNSTAAGMQLFHELRTQHNLYMPLRLYVMADKFDVPALKLLARDRFYRAAELSWRDSECFPAVVDELYTCTPPTEVAMREIVCRLVGSDIKSNEQRERMDWVMRKHGDFAVGVMDYMLQSDMLVWT